MKQKDKGDWGVRFNFIMLNDLWCHVAYQVGIYLFRRPEVGKFFGFGRFFNRWKGFGEDRLGKVWVEVDYREQANR